MARIVVLHRPYGCETGCCGHVVEVDGTEGGFYWDHPYGADSGRAFAERLIERELGPGHVADLDWENSVVLDD